MQMRRVLSVIVVAGASVGAVALAPTPVGGQAEPCAQPYAPVAFTELYPAQDEPPDVPGDNLAVAPQPVEPDTDGDGTADALDGGQGTSATVTRGSGVVELTAAGASSVSVSGVADIDDDGRDELAVVVQGGADAGSYLVPGTVADGATPAVDAGVLLTEDPAGVGLQPDGTDRLLVTRGPTPTTAPFVDTHDASDVLALGPGGDAATIGPEVSREGVLVTFVDTGDAVLGLIIGTASSGGDLGLTLVDGAAEPGVDIALTSAPEPAFGNRSGPFGPLEVIRGSEGTFVRLAQSSGSGAAEYLWSLDDPCAAYSGPAAPADTVPATPGPTTPAATTAPPSSTAPAAQPVAADARFTG